MLLRLIAALALLSTGLALVLAFLTGQTEIYIAAAIQGVVAFAVLLALANIVDYLEIIAENSKKWQ